MTWFKVDDTFHAHPKVLATDADALGLWVIAGAWSSAHLTDGFVPDHVLTRLLPGSDVLARKLVTTGMWRRTRGGHQFHDWSDFQPSANEVKSMREKRSIAGRKGGMASGKSRSKSGSNREAHAEAVASPIVEPPTRPDPTHIGGALGGSLTPPGRDGPPPRCPAHLEHPADGPCRACGDARRVRTRWELADSERRRTAPQCRTHRGQPAANCGPCRADALAAPDEEDS